MTDAEHLANQAAAVLRRVRHVVFASATSVEPALAEVLAAIEARPWFRPCELPGPPRDDAPSWVPVTCQPASAHPFDAVLLMSCPPLPDPPCRARAVKAPKAVDKRPDKLDAWRQRTGLPPTRTRGA